MFTVKAAAFGLLAINFLTGAGATQPEPTSTSGESNAVVSITFDDAWANQAAGARILTEHGLTGTFYIPSGLIGSEERLSWAQVNSMAQDGHEIAGHTVTHPDLVAVPPATARVEVCDDRKALLDRGYPGLSFSYPFASVSDEVRELPQECGYLSARNVGGLLEAESPEAPPAESLPPPNVFDIRSALDDKEEVTVERLKEYVTRTETTGGWMPLVVHRVCDECAADYWVSPDVLEEFATWLAQEQQDGRVSVRTMGEVITGQPLPEPPPGQEVQTTVNNPSLEELGEDDFPTCFLRQGFGDNSYDYAMEAGRTGGRALQLSVTSHTDGDRKIVTSQDGGTCAVAVEPGRPYDLSLWVKGQWQPSDLAIVTYLRGEDGTWTFWGQSEPLEASDDWVEGKYQTPPVLQGTDLLSFGVALTGVGQVVVDDFTATPQAPPGKGLPNWIWIVVVLALLISALVLRALRSKPAQTRRPETTSPPP